ncbi:unnamed protein product [Larinioides sclopetarius]|uniref:Phospholipase A2-like central domain-containing protein n=1 Tax=Larinioides sclopetarius TaxID=280406 RepID=A0AAV1ZV43_9ARAC
MCCRDHDHCEDHIPGYDSKYGLDNNSPFTKYEMTSLLSFIHGTKYCMKIFK